MINRARRDIAADILEAANGRTNQTSIMYGSFLFYTMVKEYFNLAAVLLISLLTYDKKTKLDSPLKRGWSFSTCTRR